MPINFYIDSIKDFDSIIYQSINWKEIFSRIEFLNGNFNWNIFEDEKYHKYIKYADISPFFNLFTDNFKYLFITRFQDINEPLFSWDNICSHCDLTEDIFKKYWDKIQWNKVFDYEMFKSEENFISFLKNNRNLFITILHTHEEDYKNLFIYTDTLGEVLNNLKDKYFEIVFNDNKSVSLFKEMYNNAKEKFDKNNDERLISYITSGKKPDIEVYDICNRRFKMIDITNNNVNQYVKNTKLDFTNIIYDNSINGILLIDSQEDKFIGIIITKYYKDDDITWISGLEINPEYQRHKIASQLIKHVIELYNVKKLGVDKLNLVAIKLYKKLGFKIVKEITNGYEMELIKD